MFLFFRGAHGLDIQTGLCGRVLGRVDDRAAGHRRAGDGVNVKGLSLQNFGRDLLQRGAGDKVGFGLLRHGEGNHLSVHDLKPDLHIAADALAHALVGVFRQLNFAFQQGKIRAGLHGAILDRLENGLAGDRCAGYGVNIQRLRLHDGGGNLLDGRVADAGGFRVGNDLDFVNGSFAEGDLDGHIASHALANAGVNARFKGELGQSGSHGQQQCAQNQR